MNAHDRPRGPAGSGTTLGGQLAGASPPLPAAAADLMCWRCGEVYPPSSACTEKRGDGPPWTHQFLERSKSIDPWAIHNYSDSELLQLARYLAGKSMSSLSTARAFAALVAAGKHLGFDADQRQSHTFARALYADKAAKRIRLLDWALDALEGRSQP